MRGHPCDGHNDQSNSCDVNPGLTLQENNCSRSVSATLVLPEWNADTVGKWVLDLGSGEKHTVNDYAESESDSDNDSEDSFTVSHSVFFFGEVRKAWPIAIACNCNGRLQANPSHFEKFRSATFCVAGLLD